MPPPKRAGRAATPDPMNLTEAARYLDVSRPTMQSLLDGGRVRHLKVSDRLYRISKADLDAYLESVTVTPAKKEPASP